MSQNSSPYYQLVNNFQFPKIFTPENIEFILNYKPEKDEKFIAVILNVARLGLNISFVLY